MTKTPWTRDEFGNYGINAKSLAPKFPVEAIPQNESFDYTVMVQKVDGRWVVSAEEHEPEELADFIGGNFFKTLAEAKAAAAEFAQFFAETLAEAWATDPEQRVALWQPDGGRDWAIPGFPPG